MGDFRASVKIEFEMSDHYAEQEWWINWSPDETGVDRRLVEWLAEQGEIGSGLIREAIYEGQREVREQEAERRERAEFERLRKKYG